MSAIALNAEHPSIFKSNEIFKIKYFFAMTYNDFASN